ncbi:MAG: hypothetical protein GKR88_16715 [Flavobacteriaceae bacterium]|nr:MAG: hypothetical protein GKR88_16715 [Flavobacteriaceae bacterium]
MTLNSFKLFGFKRTLEVFRYVESFFELHSSATEGKKDKNRAKNSNFLANSKSLNEFSYKFQTQYDVQITKTYF